MKTMSVKRKGLDSNVGTPTGKSGFLSCSFSHTFMEFPLNLFLIWAGHFLSWVSVWKTRGWTTWSLSSTPFQLWQLWSRAIAILWRKEFSSPAPAPFLSHTWLSISTTDSVSKLVVLSHLCSHRGAPEIHVLSRNHHLSATPSPSPDCGEHSLPPCVAPDTLKISEVDNLRRPGAWD